MIPRVLIERLTNLTSEQDFFRSRIRGLYFEALRPLLISMLRLES